MHLCEPQNSKQMSYKVIDVSCSLQPGMLDVLEYGLNRVTDPNENKVNQVRQGFVSHLLNLFGRTQTTSLGLWFFGHRRLSESAQP